MTTAATRSPGPARPVSLFLMDVLAMTNAGWILLFLSVVLAVVLILMLGGR